MRGALVMAMLLVGCGSDDDGGDTDVATGDPVAGETIYVDTCAGCHGEDGQAGTDIDGTPAADHTVVVPAMTDAEITDVVNNGSGAMPAQDVAAEDMDDLLAYLRQQYGGPP